MPAGYAGIPVQLLDGALFNHDFESANDNAPPGEATTVWSKPRDVEADFQTVLLAALAHYAITDVPVLRNGVFEASKLRTPDPTDPKNLNKGNIVPVIVVNMSSDSAERMGIGELAFAGPGDMANLKDGSHDGSPGAVPPIPDTVAPILVAGQSVALLHQASNVSVDVSIYCLNEELAKNTYLFVKTALFAAEQTFLALGYIKPPLRTSGSRTTSLLEQDGGTRFMFEWDLTYSATHVDFIAGIESLGRLIAIRSTTVAALDPDGAASIMVGLDQS